MTSRDKNNTVIKMNDILNVPTVSRYTQSRTGKRLPPLRSVIERRHGAAKRVALRRYVNKDARYLRGLIDKIPKTSISSLSPAQQVKNLQKHVFRSIDKYMAGEIEAPELESSMGLLTAARRQWSTGNKEPLYKTAPKKYGRVRRPKVSVDKPRVTKKRAITPTIPTFNQAIGVALEILKRVRDPNEVLYTGRVRRLPRTDGEIIMNRNINRIRTYAASLGKVIFLEFALLDGSYYSVKMLPGSDMNKAFKVLVDYIYQNVEVDVTRNIDPDHSITIRQAVDTTVREGEGFCEYVLKPDTPLSDDTLLLLNSLQIYAEDNAAKYRDAYPCLIHALTFAKKHLYTEEIYDMDILSESTIFKEVSRAVLPYLKDSRVCKDRLGYIAKSLEVQIKLTDERGQTYPYPENASPKLPVLRIGLIGNHYFHSRNLKGVKYADLGISNHLDSLGREMYVKSTCDLIKKMGESCYTQRPSDEYLDFFRFGNKVMEPELFSRDLLTHDCFAHCSESNRTFEGESAKPPLPQIEVDRLLIQFHADLETTRGIGEECLPYSFSVVRSDNTENPHHATILDGDPIKQLFERVLSERAAEVTVIIKDLIKCGKAENNDDPLRAGFERAIEDGSLRIGYFKETYSKKKSDHRWNNFGLIKWIINKSIKTEVFFHNLKFDFGAILHAEGEYISGYKEFIGTLSSLKSVVLEINSMKHGKQSVKLIDTYSKIPMPLDSFAKTFKLKSGKQYMPYDLFDTLDNTLDILRAGKVRLWRFLSGLPKKFENEYEHVIIDLKERGLLTGDFVDITRLLREYNNADVITQCLGYEAFNNKMLELTHVDVRGCLTIGSVSKKIAEAYTGLWRDQTLCEVMKGPLSEFVRKNVMGGVCQMRNNKSILIDLRNDPEMFVQDLDINSLYPYCYCKPMGGGSFHVVGEEVLKDVLSDNLNTFRDIPFLATIEIKNIPVDKGISFIFGKTVEGYEGNYIHKIDPEKPCTMMGTNYTIQLLEEYHGMKLNEDYLITSLGYYDYWVDVMEDFVMEFHNLRNVYKREKDDAASTLIKLILNNLWGKTIQRTFNDYCELTDNKEQAVERFRTKNNIDTIEEHGRYWFLSGKKNTKKLPESLGQFAHFILSYSKLHLSRHIRAMEDAGGLVQYIDTDSMHCVTSNKIIDDYRKIFELSYGSDPLALDENGDDILGNMKSDYKPPIKLKNVRCVRNVFYEKKVYCAQIRGEKEDGSSYDFVHFKAKGLTKDAVLSKASELYPDMDRDESIMTLYEYLLKKKEKRRDILLECADELFSEYPEDERVQRFLEHHNSNEDDWSDSILRDTGLRRYSHVKSQALKDGKEHPIPDDGEYDWVSFDMLSNSFSIERTKVGGYYRTSFFREI